MSVITDLLESPTERDPLESPTENPMEGENSAHLTLLEAKNSSVCRFLLLPL